MNIERYIKGLDPKLQERMRACENAEEILTIVKEEGLELPDEALDTVYGGCGTSYTYQVDDYWRCVACKNRIGLRSVGHDGFPDVYWCQYCFTTKTPGEIEHYYNKRKVVKG